MKLKRLIFSLLLSSLVFTQISATNSYFSSIVISSSNDFSAGCWVAPSVPVLISPANNTVRKTDGMVMDWFDSTTSCPLSTVITYQYESYSDPGLTNRLYQSGWLSDSQIPAPGTPDGDYYWHVRSQDNHGNISVWSSPWKVTIDSSDPTSSLDPILPLFQTLLPLSLTYTAQDYIDYVQLCYSFQSQPWVCPDNPSFKSSSGSFSFSAPDGDGLYLFETIAHDLAGYVETKTLDIPLNPLLSSYVIASIDTQAPTTNINGQTLNINQWRGGNLVVNGDFHDSLNGWSTSSGGQHLVTDIDDQKALFLRPDSSQDAVWQVVSVPQNNLSQLSFKFRYGSNDFAPQNQFQVQIRQPDDSPDSPVITENILNFGNISLTPSYDSGWLDLIHPLYDYAGRTIKLWFGITQTGSDPSKNNWVYIENVRLSPVEVRVGDTNPVDFIATDLTSGLLTTPSPAPLVTGVNQIGFTSTDIAGNVEPPHSGDIIVLPPVVLNKIDFITGKVYLYNNTLGDQLNDGFYLRDLSTGETQPLSFVSIGATSSLEIGLSLPYVLPDTLELHSSTSLIDSTKYLATNGLWHRNPDGVGTWVMSAVAPLPLSLNLTHPYGNNKLTLTLDHIDSEYDNNTTDNLQYEILYQSSGTPKGISGQIFKTNIVDGKTDRDFFLGTCSSGTCTNDPVDVGSTITVNLTGKIRDVVITPLTQSISF